MSRPLRHYLAALCVGYLALTLFTIALGDGGQKIPWEVPDSRGRVFSFNQPMSGEHFAIAMGQVTLRGMVHEAGWHGILLVIMQLAGLVVMLWAFAVRTGFIRTFFLIQLLIFPFGWPAMLGFPWVFVGGIDAEALTDGPPFWCWSQGPWLVACGTFLLLSLGKRRPEVS